MENLSAASCVAGASVYSLVQPWSYTMGTHQQESDCSLIQSATPGDHHKWSFQAPA